MDAAAEVLPAPGFGACWIFSLTGGGIPVLVMFMHGIAAQTLADRFAWLFDGLCRAVGADARRQRMEAALAWAIWNRVRLLGDRLIALAERVRAGRVPRRRSPRSDTSPRLVRSAAQSPQGGEGEAREVQKPGSPALTLPREFGWVRRMLPETGQYAGLLRYLLRDPETVALLEKAPEAGRVLRPLCHLLGVQTPEFLRRGAVVAPEAAAPIAAEVSPPPEPEVPDRSQSLRPSDRVADDAAVTKDGATVPPAAQPPPPGRSPAEEAALAYARRPGGLYWDGTRMRWS